MHNRESKKVRNKIAMARYRDMINALWVARHRRPEGYDSQHSSAILDDTRERMRRQALERRLAERLAARKAGRK